jgi:hypothetical protein
MTLPPAAADHFPALRCFGAASFAEAAGPARRFLAGVPRCVRCSRVLTMLHERVGSILFYDDNPHLLSAAFDADDRDPCTLRLLAACIVVFGRPRQAPAIAVDARETKRLPRDELSPAHGAPFANVRGRSTGMETAIQPAGSKHVR